MLDELRKSPKLASFCRALLEGHHLLVECLWDAPKAVLATLALQETGKNILILTGRAKEELRLFEDFPFFKGEEVEDFPAWETLPSDHIAPSPDIVGERYSVLRKLGQKGRPQIVIASVQACLQRLIPPSCLHDLSQELELGMPLSLGDFADKLQRMGYERKAIAADKGEYAVRGGIVDVFPVNSTDPLRLEFWDDRLDSMRLYDPVGQKSVKKISHMQVTPAQEMELLWKQQETCFITDYLGEDTLILFDDLLAIEDRYVSLEKMVESQSQHFSSFHDFFDRLGSFQHLYFAQSYAEALTRVLPISPGETSEASASSLPALRFEMFSRNLEARRWFHPFSSVQEHLCPVEYAEGEVTAEDLLQGVSSLKGLGFKLQFLCPNESDEVHLKKQLAEGEVQLPANTEFVRGYLSTGFVLSEAQLVLLPLTELTKRYRIRRQKQRSTYHSTPSQMHELLPGDFVVHLNSGIGEFQGIEKQADSDQAEAEFFVIKYADNAKIYVPFTQAHLLTKYVGAKEDEAPKLHRLGGNRWKNTRQQTERAVMGYASDLLRLYAARSLKKGEVYPEDGEDMVRFEQDFPYHETQDQLAAIADIKRDMMSEQVMDRLVCGDVGYGKTEVAMRAAFKAVVDGGKQVAVLVPTTVLAMQHFETFRDRMWNFPVRVGVLSRFSNSRQAKETLEALQQGSLDILVGTHRIIGKEVQYKNLGLVIIDEEQRFGVKAKEYLKAIRHSVDCLTLSATPIPRTLYMSLVGARDMSTIGTPPEERLPIKTIICEIDDQVLKSAILRELHRDGQIYVIHNRVETLPLMVERLQKIVPQAKVTFAHGQMSSEEIDGVFHAFKGGKIDVLVATTLVENGIDIPNANTLLIDRADRFGLADLYQLRGRVGRWNRRAYAYFLTPKKQALSSIARKRLEALVEASAVQGGGMKVALRDLEIRGAGNLLGTEQSGHVASIGFHFYCKLLKRTMETLKGELPSTLCETKMEFVQDARLPEAYVNATSLRLEIYQRLGEATSLEEVDQIFEELNDRFGSPPEPVQWLYRLTRIRVYASLNHITSIKIQKFSCLIEGKKNGKLQVKKALLPPVKTAEDLEKKVMELLNP